MKRSASQITALGYIRVSTEEQVQEGASLAAQTEALEADAERRGWILEIVADQGRSAKTLNRPGLQDAIGRLDNGEADALMAVRLDRVSRSVADFAGLLARARKRGWRLRLLSPDLDTEDAAGKFTAHVLAAAAEYERDLIGLRTREGMAQRRAEGAHVGRPPTLPLSTVAVVVELRSKGASIRKIARELDDIGIEPARAGTRWSASSVQAVLKSTRAASFSNPIGELKC